MNIQGILDFLPHRYPFLLIDRVLDYEDHTWLTAIKNVTYNEPYFQGHFPDNPVMPGVLIIEAMAQATALLALRSGDIRLDGSKLYYLVGVDKTRIKSPVIPGDQLLFRVEQQKMVRGVGRCDVTASVEGKVVASAQIMGAIRDAKA
jgi:3-hydroxyacyl-[acyl-carrier-protein] dehydratase